MGKAISIGMANQDKFSAYFGQNKAMPKATANPRQSAQVSSAPATGGYGMAPSAPLPQFKPPAFNPPMLVMPEAVTPTLDLSGIPTSQMIQQNVGKMLGGVKNTNDAAARQALASLASRAGGDTSSPMYQLMASRITGGAAANTGAQMLDAKLQAMREGTAAEVQRANLGLGLINAQTSDRALNSQNALAAANYGLNVGREAFGQSLATAQENRASQGQQFEQGLANRQLGLSEQELALREKLGLGELDLGKGRLALDEKLGVGGLELDQQKQDYLQFDTDRKFVEDQKNKEKYWSLKEREFSLTAEQQAWLQAFEEKKLSVESALAKERMSIDRMGINAQRDANADRTALGWADYGLRQQENDFNYGGGWEQQAGGGGSTASEWDKLIANLSLYR